MNSNIVREVAIALVYVVLHLGAVGLGTIGLFFLLAKILGGLHE